MDIFLLYNAWTTPWISFPMISEHNTQELAWMLPFLAARAHLTRLSGLPTCCSVAASQTETASIMYAKREFPLRQVF